MTKPFSILIAAAVAVTLALPLAAADLGHADIASWIESVGGSSERDAQGHIVAVDLGSAWITDDDLALIAKLDNLERLDLSYTWVSDLGLEHLKPLENVRELSLYYCDYITDAAVIPLKGWKKLEILNLEGTDVTSRSFEHIADLTSLRVLKVGHSRVEDEGFENLAPLAKLEEIEFGGNKMSGRALPLLKMLPSLKSIDLGGRQRTDSGLWGVALSDFNLDALAEMTNLEALDLHDTQVGDRGLAQLEPLKRLSRLNISGTRVTDAGLDALSGFTALEQIRLWRTQVGDAGAAKLAKLAHLKALDLADTKLTDAGLVRLAEAPALEALFIRNTAVTAAGISALRSKRPGLKVFGGESR